MNECDCCPVPATVVRPATERYEQAYYCDHHAKRSLSTRAGDKFRPVKDAGSNA